MRIVAYTSAARRALRGFPDKVQAQIKADVVAFAATGKGDVTKLQGRKDAYRLRSGNYRIVFSLTTDTVTVEGIGDRKDIYR